MKRIIALFLMASILFLGACNYSAGFKKDFGTGLSFNYNGFHVQNVLLVGPGNKVMDNNKVQLNTQMAIVALGIANYGLKEEKVFPGMMIVVTDKHGSEVLKGTDLFLGTEGYTPANATELRGTITIAKPMIAGETYHLKMHVWDKVKPENVLDAETDIVVQ
ncbi:hypothetical protein Q4E93_18915 [Flavitalea sp. BT771]|uniref:hypothetical protein n=1 Tax=Flavitalea sp. BT771 TaxID=3063329 RepID=UPI0026E13B5F|nr:hypothetical protein [Flavitalea sp. BT771]MDO6432685.1 hypothetical protein [Flavitalea sp. BT771]MDV6222039.1 hypothetical protein [Flavitalea sp. BT771]